MTMYLFYYLMFGVISVCGLFTILINKTGTAEVIKQDFRTTFEVPDDVSDHAVCLQITALFATSGAIGWPVLLIILLNDLRSND